MKKLNQVWRVVVVSAILACSGGTALAEATLDVLCNNNAGQPLKRVEVFSSHYGPDSSRGSRRMGRGGLGSSRCRPDTTGCGPEPRATSRSTGSSLNLKDGATESVTLGFEPGDSAQLLYFEDSASLQKAQELYTEGAQALRQQQFDQAEEKLKTACQLNPSNPDALQTLGIVQLQKKSWDEAHREPSGGRRTSGDVCGTWNG